MDGLERIQPGITGELARTVDETLVTRHVGGAGILGTPFMILLMENASHFAVEPFLPPGTTTVGFEVCVKHLAPTMLGGKVRVSSRLVEVDGRKLRFEVECHEGDKLCGTGTHRRTIVAATTPVECDGG